ncbi:uncharacterized protein BDV14DRAFT_202806 [Aspergillus stella-maris]|uniref:uncharacterized protein n=1 Tax=Aspergillus stella-maris TaxID=1810926 RepID=UPI003CCD4179
MASTWSQQLTAKLFMAVIDKLEEKTGEMNYDGLAELMGPDISGEMIKTQIAMLEKQAEQLASGTAAPVKPSRDVFAGIDDDDDEEVGEVWPYRKRRRTGQTSQDQEGSSRSDNDRKSLHNAKEEEEDDYNADASDDTVDDGGHAGCDHESDEAQDGDEGQDGGHAGG